MMCDCELSHNGMGMALRECDCQGHVAKTATEPPMTPAMLHFICEQLREWGGLPEAEIASVYKREMDAMEAVDNAG